MYSDSITAPIITSLSVSVSASATVSKHSDSTLPVTFSTIELSYSGSISSMSLRLLPWVSSSSRSSKRVPVPAVLTSRLIWSSEASV